MSSQAKSGRRTSNIRMEKWLGLVVLFTPYLLVDRLDIFTRITNERKKIVDYMNSAIR